MLARAALLLSCFGGLLFVSTGCGYRPMLPANESASAIRAEARDAGRGEILLSERMRSMSRPRLAVAALRNDSPEPWLDRILGEALRREMLSRGTVRLVNDPAQAELVLRGRIRPLIVQSQSFSSFVAALEYSVTLEVDLEILRASGDVIRLDPAMLSESDVYLASADIEVTRTHRLEALRRLSDVLATRVADSVDLMEQPIRVTPAEHAEDLSEAEGAR
jgi:hypothetical protein